MIGNIAYAVSKKINPYGKIFVEYHTPRKKYHPIDKITIGRYLDDLFDG